MDVGRKALQVHGGPGRDLQRALSALRALRQEAADEAHRRERVKVDMAQRSRERAQRLAAASPAQRLCTQLQVAHDSRLPKSRAMELFGLEPGMLAGLEFDSKVGASPGRPGWGCWVLLGCCWAQLVMCSGLHPPAEECRPPCWRVQAACQAATRPQPLAMTRASPPPPPGPAAQPQEPALCGDEAVPS